MLMWASPSVSYLAFHLSESFFCLFLASVCLHHVLHLLLSRSPSLVIFPFSFSMSSRKGTVPGPEIFFWYSYFIDKWP